MALDKVPEVEIDADGVFKYVLIELKDKQGLTKTIVRGYEWAEYHGRYHLGYSIKTKTYL